MIDWLKQVSVTTSFKDLHDIAIVKLRENHIWAQERTWLGGMGNTNYAIYVKESNEVIARQIINTCVNEYMHQN